MGRWRRYARIVASGAAWRIAANVANEGLFCVLYEDARKPNRNRRGAFDKAAQGKLADAVCRVLGERYQADSPLDDVLYLMRIWQAEFGDAHDDVSF